MPKITINDIESNSQAQANQINTRIGTIVDLVNGNLDSDNLADGAVTNSKIADRTISSGKLNFSQYTDDNGWLITDLGLVKLATKIRTFTVSNVGINNTQFVTFDTGMSSNPVGFDSGSIYNMAWSFSGKANVGDFSFVVENSDNPLPNCSVVATQQTSSPASSHSYRMHMWVIF